MTLLDPLRALAARFGYRIEKTAFQRYGIDPIVDVERLSGKFDIPIRRAFDVGANVGQTATALRRVFPAAELFCFEPVDTTYRQLAQATASMSRTRAFPLALSDREGEAVLHRYDSSLLASLEPDALFTQGRPATTEPCRTQTLDRFCEEQSVDGIDLLKIDTEGHDLAVLRGATSMLEGARIGFVLIEFNRLAAPGEKQVGSLSAIAELLDRYGYSFICSYIDDIVGGERPFVIGNALFVRDSRT